MVYICRKTLYHPHILNLQRMHALALRIHQELISKSMQHIKAEKFRIKKKNYDWKL